MRLLTLNKLIRLHRILFLILFTLNWLPGYSQLAGSAKTKTEEVTKGNFIGLKDIGIEGRELTAQRGRTAKHYQLADGKFEAIFTGGQSLHYLDENATWRDIDPLIRVSGQSDFKYENITNTIKSYFPENNAVSGGILCSTGKDGENVRMGINQAIILVNKHNMELTELETMKSSVAVKEANYITYNNTFSNADVEYIVEPDRVKHNIILNTLPGYLTGISGLVGFSEEIELPEGWGLVSEDHKIIESGFYKGSVFIINAENTTVFEFPEPEIFEKNNPEIMYGVLDDDPNEKNYLIRVNGNSITIATLVPAEWLQQRQFPVVVDPTLTFTGINSSAWGGYIGYRYNVNSTHQYSNASNNVLCIHGYSSYYRRGWMRFQLTGFTNPASVTQVRGRFYQRYDYGGTTTIYVRDNDYNYGPYSAWNLGNYNDFGNGSTYTSFSANSNGYYGYYTLGGTVNNDVFDAIAIGSFQMGFRMASSSNRFKYYRGYNSSIQVTYTNTCSTCCYNGYAAESNSTYSDGTGCGSKNIKLGGGAYYNLPVDARTYYSFSWSESASNINGFCADPQNGSGSSGKFTSNQTAWYSGTTTSLRITAIRSSATWTSTSATMTYQRVSPTLTNNSPSSTQTICSGSSVNISSGSTTYTYRPAFWQNTTSNGTSLSSYSSPQSVSSPGTYYYRAYNGDNANSRGCWGQQRSTTVQYYNSGTANGTWVGNISSDWADCRNWGGGVVPSGIDVQIPNGSPNDPIISSSVPSVTSINIQSGGDLRVISGGSLDVTAGNFSGAALRNYGYFQISGGDVDLNNNGLRQFGNANFTMSSGTFYTGEWLYNDNGDVNVQINISGGYLDINRIPNYAGVINHSGGTIDCRGYYRENDPTTPGAYIGSGSAVINFRGTSNQYFHLFNTNTRFNDVNIYNSAYYISTASTYYLDVNGDFYIQSGGGLDANGYRINVAGDWTNSGTFTNDNNEVYIDGTGAQNLNAGGTGAAKQFYDMYITNNGTVTLQSNMEVDRNFYVQGGTFAVNGNDLYTLNAGGTNIGVAEISSGATVNVSGSSAYWRVANGNAGPLTIYGILNQSTGTVESGGNMTLNATGTVNQTGGRIGSGDTFTISGDYNGDGGTLQLYGGGDLYSPTLYVTNSSAYFNNLEADDNGTNRSQINGSSQTIVVNNNLTILSGGNLDANGVDIHVGGDWTNNGNTESGVIGFTAAGNQVRFTGTGNVAGSAVTTFYDLANTGGTRTQTVNTNVLNSLSVSSGTYKVNAARILNFSNGAAATVASGATFEALGSSGNNVVISSGSGNYSFSMNGNMRASYATFSNMSGNGIDMSANTAAFPSNTEDFDNCTFSNWIGSQALLLRDNLGISGSNMTFTNSGGTNISHVSPASSNALVTVTGASSGTRWGEAYDGETEGGTFSTINWADTYTFTVSGADFGSGTPSNGTYYYGNETGNNVPGSSINAVNGSCMTGFTGTGSAPSGSGNSSPAFSITQNSTLTWNWVTPATSILWTASDNDDWTEEGNWSCYGLPTINTDVVIDPANLDPGGALTGPVIYNGDIGSSKTLTINQAGTIEVTINNGGNLIVNSP